MDNNYKTYERYFLKLHFSKTTENGTLTKAALSSPNTMGINKNPLINYTLFCILHKKAIL